MLSRVVVIACCQLFNEYGCTFQNEWINVVLLFVSFLLSLLLLLLLQIVFITMHFQNYSCYCYYCFNAFTGVCDTKNTKTVTNAGGADPFSFCCREQSLADMALDSEWQLWQNKNNSRTQQEPQIWQTFKCYHTITGITRVQLGLGWTHQWQRWPDI